VKAGWAEDRQIEREHLPCWFARRFRFRRRTYCSDRHMGLRNEVLARLGVTGREHIACTTGSDHDDALQCLQTSTQSTVGQNEPLEYLRQCYCAIPYVQLGCSTSERVLVEKRRLRN